MTENRAGVPRPVVVAAILVMLAATVSAGIHAGLVPDHLGEVPLLGVSFILAVLALLAHAAAVAIRPQAQLSASLAALLFAALILAYAASRTTGLPVLEPEPEPVDAIGIVTVAVQLVGLLAALWLTRAADRRRSVATGDSPGSSPGVLPHRATFLALAGLVAIAFAVVVLDADGGHGAHGHGELHAHGELHE